jgi:hypothetical protein
VAILLCRITRQLLCALVRRRGQEGERQPAALAADGIRDADDDCPSTLPPVSRFVPWRMIVSHGLLPEVSHR